MAKQNKLYKAELEEMKVMLIRMYNLGYLAGHNDTVEGVFTDIYNSDMETYHSEVVEELYEEYK